MIFVTVGGQLAFDRLIRAVDRWTEAHPDAEVFAQIGETSFVPKSMPFVSTLTPSEFRERAKSASLIVAHAGMGTILTALELGVPILVMPRNAGLGEHRNDHQLATVKHLRDRGLIHCVGNEDELVAKLSQLDSIAAPDPIPPYASGELLTALRRFIADS